VVTLVREEAGWWDIRWFCGEHLYQLVILMVPDVVLWWPRMRNMWIISFLKHH